MNHFGGISYKDIMEQPLIMDKIVDILLCQNEWVSVLAMRHVFRFHDGFDSSKLTNCIRFNTVNKKLYEENCFIDGIGRKVADIQGCRKFSKRIKLNDILFDYIYDNNELFRLDNISAIRHSVLETLMYYYHQEPFYELQSIKYMKKLFPDYFYEVFTLTNDDHETDLFDNDY